MKGRIIISLLICFNINLPALAQISNDTPPTKIVRFFIKGNQAIEERRLQQILALYINTKLDWTNITAARSALVQYYQSQGYPAAIALIPHQDLSTGEITIEIREGQLESIEVTGNTKLSTRWLESQITRSPLKIEDLEKELRLIRQNPLIEDLKGELVAGNELGSPILKLQVTERNIKSWTYESHNYASPVSGRWENSITYVNPSLSGQTDLLGLRVGITEGATNINSLYDFPINSQGQRLQISFNRSKRQVTEDPISILDLQSSATQISLGGSFPLVREPERQIDFNPSIDWQKSQTRLDGELFPFSSATNTGETEIWAARFKVESNFRSQQSATVASSQLSLGIGSQDRTFITWNNSLNYSHKIGNLTAKTSIQTQLASQNLFPEEQFTLGGIAKGRGYRLNELLGDNGVFGSIGLEIPINDKIALTPFLEAGRVWGRGYGDSIASTGVSLEWNLGDFNLRGDLAFPLAHTNDPENFLFSVQYKF